MKPLTVLLVLCLLGSSCLENEEEIEIRPDGSARVTLKSTGDVEDLTGGFPVPLHGPWRADDSITRSWLESFGPATGGAAVRQRFAEGAWSEMGDPEQPGVTLAVSAEFPDVSEIPRFLAPEREAYRSAFLERNSRLTITPKGSRTIYVFERAYPQRPFWNRFDEEHVPSEVLEALQAGRRLTDEQVRHFTASLREWAHTAPSMHVVTSALGAVYTEGDASLSPEAFSRCLEQLHQVIDRTIVPETVQSLFDTLITEDANGSDLPPEVDLERNLRNGARSAIAGVLTEEGVPVEVRNAVLERLEWNFTSYDLAQDIGDETFKLSVAMPGRIVDGNFDVREGNSASWTFEGSQLHGAGRVLRVVSVLE